MVNSDFSPPGWLIVLFFAYPFVGSCMILFQADATGEFPRVYKELEESGMFLEHALLYESYARFLFSKGRYWRLIRCIGSHRYLQVSVGGIRSPLIVHFLMFCCTEVNAFLADITWYSHMDLMVYYVLCHNQKSWALGRVEEEALGVFGTFEGSCRRSRCRWTGMQPPDVIILFIASKLCTVLL